MKELKNSKTQKPKNSRTYKLKNPRTQELTNSKTQELKNLQTQKLTTMRKVIGIGETILDILFRNGQPQAAVPGGSVYNAMISLGRMGMDVTFISETGNDRVGSMILDNMRANGVRTDNVNVFPDGKSPVSLAFLNENNDAEYIFYKDYPRQRLDVTMPDIQADDIVMIGSYFAV